MAPPWSSTAGAFSPGRGRSWARPCSQNPPGDPAGRIFGSGWRPRALGVRLGRNRPLGHLDLGIGRGRRLRRGAGRRRSAAVRSTRPGEARGYRPVESGRGPSAHQRSDDGYPATQYGSGQAAPAPKCASGCATSTTPTQLSPLAITILLATRTRSNEGGPRGWELQEITNQRIDVGDHVTATAAGSGRGAARARRKGTRHDRSGSRRSRTNSSGTPSARCWRRVESDFMDCCTPGSSSQPSEIQLIGVSRLLASILQLSHRACTPVHESTETP